MSRVLIHVEGQTEETFVSEVIGPHLYNVGFLSVGARLLGNARLRSRRGGIKDWQVVRQEIHRHLANDPGCIATLLVDFYALPGSWPGRLAAGALPHGQRGAHVHQAIDEDFATFSAHADRFEPFVLMHEFEALLFSDCDGFARGLGQPERARAFQKVRDQFGNPEEINDSPETAPSKRVCKIVPGYQKPLFGNLAAIEIGLERIREECPHFDAWLTRLEARVA